MTTKEQIAKEHKIERKLSEKEEESVIKEAASKFNLDPKRVEKMYKSQFLFLRSKVADGKHENVRIRFVGLWFTNDDYTNYCIKQDAEFREANPEDGVKRISRKIR